MKIRKVTRTGVMIEGKRKRIKEDDRKIQVIKRRRQTRSK